MKLCTDLTTSQGNLIETLPALGKEFRIYFEFSLTSYAGSGQSNLVQFSNQGPGVFVDHDNGNKFK